MAVPKSKVSRQRRDKRRSSVWKLEAGRVDFIAPADYRDNSKLSRRVQLLLDSVIAGIAYAAEVAACKAENR